MPRKLVYDVAVSIDGFITGPGESLDGFLFAGDHVADYEARLAAYGAVIMGRKTYEIGYRFGMPEGAAPYGDKPHLVFSKSLQLPHESAVEVVREGWLEAVDRLKAQDGGEICLCGGGALAGLMLESGRLDTLVLKVNPVVLGQGTRLFDTAWQPRGFTLASSKSYASGVVLTRYEMG